MTDPQWTRVHWPDHIPPFRTVPPFRLSAKVALDNCDLYSCFGERHIGGTGRRHQPLSPDLGGRRLLLLPTHANHCIPVAITIEVAAGGYRWQCGGL